MRSPVFPVGNCKLANKAENELDNYLLSLLTKYVYIILVTLLLYLSGDFLGYVDSVGIVVGEEWRW